MWKGKFKEILGEDCTGESKWVDVVIRGSSCPVSSMVAVFLVLGQT